MAKRNIIEIVEQIKKERFEDIINSDLSVNLLWAWSQLFNNGQEPSWCVKCMRRYYSEITLHGTEMAINLEEAKQRTCIPNWNGNKYIHRAGRHYSNVYITDKQAIDLLEKNLINESDFIKLPDGYISKNTKPVNVEIIEEKKSEEIIPEIKKNTNLSKSKKAKK
jgi:hypothetical protein